MKKMINFNTVFALLAFASVLYFSACKKDASDSGGLTGVWSASISKTGTVSQYVFKGDMTYEHTFTATDTMTKKSLGIMTKETGKYQIKDKTLNLYDIVNYLNKNKSYGPATDLERVDGLKTSNYTMELKDSRKTLSLEYICGPAENCLPTGTAPSYFYKQ